MISIKSMGLDDLLWGEKNIGNDETKEGPLSDDILRKVVYPPLDSGGGLCFNGTVRPKCT